MKPLIDKQSFVGLDTCTWLYSGAETPTYKGCLEAVNEYLTVRSKGPGGRDRNELVAASCKENIARLLNGCAQDIAFLSNSSEVISMISQSIDWNEGDNIVLNTLEFPAGVLPWLRLKEKGVEVRIVEHNRWKVTPEDILARVDDRTRIVMTSHVSYLSGARLDYRKLFHELKKTKTLLLLDATQSLGAISVDMNEADFVVCSSYKWLLSIHGLGILAVNPARLSGFLGKSIGWRSVSDMFGPKRFETYTFFNDARRFELGYPAYSAVYALNASIKRLLEIGTDRVEQHILQLGGDLIERLTEKGYTIMTPREPENRAGNICIVAQQGEEISERLRQQEIYVWGGDGRFRASIHLFNSSEDIDRLLRALPKNVEQGAEL